MSYDAILFDFDGTIVDSEQHMLDALNAVSNEFGFTPLNREEISQLRKLSARELVTERLRIPIWKVWKLYWLERRAKEEFARRSAGLHVFTGMQEVIGKLHDSGLKMGIVSSAASHVVKRVVHEAKLPFDFIYAGSSAIIKAYAIKAAIAKEGIDKRRVVYVGDEIRDVEACDRVGIPIIAVGWGLNDAETLRSRGVEVASTPEELFSMITK